MTIEGTVESPLRSITCFRCGAQQQGRLCKRCGAQLLCSSCASPLGEGLRFCLECGTRVIDSAAPPSPPATEDLVTAPSVPDVAPPAPVLEPPARPRFEPSEIGARRSARRMLEKARSPGTAWLELGLATARAGDWLAAYRQLERALRERDEAADEGQIHALMAEVAHHAALPVDEARHTLYAVGASERARRGDVMTAVAAAAKLSDVSALSTYGRALLRMGSVGRGLGSVVLALAGAHDEAVSSARRITPRTDGPEETVKTLRWAVDALLDTDRPGEDVALAVCLAELATLAGARTTIRRAARAAIATGSALDTDLPVARAYALLAENVSSPRTRADHLFEAGRHYAWGGDHAQAVELLSQAAELSPTRRVFYQLAEAERVRAWRPDPPEIDPDTLARARDAWLRGWRLGPPSAEQTWAYSVAGLIADQWDRLDVSGGHESSWEAVKWLTTAVVTGGDFWDAWIWTQLVSQLREIAPCTCRIATSILQEILESNRPSLDAAIVDDALVEIVLTADSLVPPEVPTALATAERYAVDDEKWISLIRGWHAFRAGRRAVAVRHLHRAHELAPDDARVLFALARGLYLQGRPDEARPHAEKLLERVDGVLGVRPSGTGWNLFWAWAALWTGRPEEAEAAVAAALEPRPEHPRGDLDELVLLAVCRIRRGDLAGARSVLEDGLGHPQSTSQFADAAADLGFALEGGAVQGGADESMHRLVTRYQRVFRARYRGQATAPDPTVDNAVDELRGRIAEPGHSAHERRAVSILAVLLLGRARRWSDAAAQLRSLGRKPARPAIEDLERWIREGFLAAIVDRLMSDDTETALHALTELRTADLPAEQTAGIWWGKLTVAGYWRLHALLADAPEADQAHLSRVLTHLDGWLDDRFGTSTPSRDTDSVEPTPITLELGSALVPSDAAEKWAEWDLFARLIPRMRDAVKRDTGVDLPGVRVRENLRIRGHEYVIRLREVPYDGGQVSESALEPLTAVIAHVEDVVRRDLRKYIGPDEVADLLRAWSEESGAPGGVADAAADAEKILWLTAVARRLVYERVSLGERDAILAAAERCGWRGRPRDVIREIRLTVRERLPGNEPDAARVDVTPEWEASATVDPRGVRADALLTWQLVERVRALVEHSAGPVVVVTSMPELRPSLHDMLAEEFPGVAVLAAEELTSA